MLRICWTFIKRDFLVSKSYKLAFTFDIISLVFTVAGFFLVSKMVGGEGARVLGKYQGSYISFVIIGLAFSGYMITGLHVFKGEIFREQYLGTLEKLFLFSIKPEWSIVLMLGSYTFISGTVRILGYLLIGGFMFGVDFSNMNLSATLAAVFLTVVIYVGLGAVSAGFTILFKRGNPLDFVLSGLMVFFGGIYFPVELIPDYIRWISTLIPISHSLYAIRMALLNGYNIMQLLNTMAVLSGFALACIIVGIAALRISIVRAKINGSLGTQ
jgi:ABC-2 type transport system permease protein